MKTKQALFLAVVNVLFAIVAMRWFEASWEQLRRMINFVHENGHVGGSRWAGVWSITMLGQQNEVTAHFTNYPAIFFYILVGVNIFFILAFILWNKRKTSFEASKCDDNEGTAEI